MVRKRKCRGTARSKSRTRKVLSVVEKSDGSRDGKRKKTRKLGGGMEEEKKKIKKGNANAE